MKVTRQKLLALTFGLLAIGFVIGVYAVLPPARTIMDARAVRKGMSQADVERIFGPPFMVGVEPSPIGPAAPRWPWQIWELNDGWLTVHFDPNGQVVRSEASVGYWIDRMRQRFRWVTGW